GTDLAGNELPAASQVEFTLAVEVDDTAPYLVSLVTSVDPALHRLRASFRFSEAMDNDSVEAAFGSQPGLACNWSWSAPDVAQCQVNAGLRQDTSYTLVLGVTAADLAGNTLEVPWTAELPVGDLAPRLVSVAPRRDAFNVSVTAPITLTFSE